MEIEICPGAEIGSGLVAIPDCRRTSPSGPSCARRACWRPACWLPPGAAEETARIVAGSGHKVLLVIVGGVRHDESFSPDGLVNSSPPLGGSSAAIALVPPCAQRGSDAHFNAILQHT